MPMRFTFIVEAEVERIEGKFAAKADLAEQIKDELESAEPSGLTGENGGEYEVTSWEITER